MPQKHHLSMPASVAFMCSFIVAVAIPFWEAVRHLPDSHPLPVRLLLLRLVGMFATALCIGIAFTYTFRSRRAETRLRDGLCQTCGYDLRVQLDLSGQRESNRRASTDCCPECGSELPAARPGA
jgi:hypothetical protein